MRGSKEIGRIVRKLRGSVSLREFAKKCDMSHTTIDNIEKGIDFRTGKPTQIKITTLQKIASACGVPIAYIIGDGVNMDTLSRILFILQSNNIEQKELCDFLQISNSVFSDWKSGRNKSYKKRISEIAQFLNVSADYLLGNTDTPASSEENNISLSDIEIRLIRAYRENVGMQFAVNKLLGIETDTHKTS